MINLNDLISIIVPIYKVELYINKCIDSILNQTYTNLEIILVDDGSPDNCGRICDDYKKRDSRIKVIHKKNGGLSEARNYGIDLSTGDYILFVDSDDYIHKNMCKILLEKANKYDVDIVSCNLIEIYPDNSSKNNKQIIDTEEKVFSNIKMIEQYFFNYTVDLNVVWNKLYRRKIFFNKERLRFPVGKLHEDNYMIYKFYYYANRILVIKDILYYYVRRENSITSNITEQSIIDRTKAGIEEYNFAKNINKKKFRQMVLAHSINVYMGLINFSFSLKENLNSSYFLNLYRREIINHTILFNPYVNIKTYLKYLIIKLHLEYKFTLLKIRLKNVKKNKKYIL